MHSRSFFRNPSPILVGPCGLLMGVPLGAGRPLRPPVTCYCSPPPSRPLSPPLSPVLSILSRGSSSLPSPPMSLVAHPPSSRLPLDAQPGRYQGLNILRQRFVPGLFPSGWIDLMFKPRIAAGPRRGATSTTQIPGKLLPCARNPSIEG